MAYLYLIIAIIAEIVATTIMKGIVLILLGVLVIKIFSKSIA